MGSQAKQASFWGKHPEDWAAIQEQTGSAGYEHALNLLKLTGNENLLDIGCGTGFFCRLAYNTGAHVSGMDATAGFVEQAKLRVPEINFHVGEMEELPFADGAFDVVTGFNSFQYAESPANALAEAKRVLKPGGRLIAMIWGNREDCEAASFLKAVGALMPPPPTGAAGPFALTESHLLEQVLTNVGFNVVNSTDVDSPWDYTDKETALKGLMAAGPVTAAVAFSGVEKTTQALAESIVPFIQLDGRVLYHNKFRVVLAVKNG